MKTVHGSTLDSQHLTGKSSSKLLSSANSGLHLKGAVRLTAIL